jgi:5'-nucleotidase
MNREFIIALDVDEVLADLYTAWLNRYNAAYSDDLCPCDMDGWDMVSQVKPECGERIYDFLTPDIYDEVKPFHGALETVTKLREQGRVIFVTAGNPEAKLQWLRKHGFLPQGHLTGDKDYFACKDKSLIRADVLFDDYNVNVNTFPGWAFLVTHFHNQKTPCERERVPGFGIKEAPVVVARLLELERQDSLWG